MLCDHSLGRAQVPRRHRPMQLRQETRHCPSRHCIVALLDQASFLAAEGMLDREPLPTAVATLGKGRWGVVVPQRQLIPELRSGELERSNPSEASGSTVSQPEDSPSVILFKVLLLSCGIPQRATMTARPSRVVCDEHGHPSRQTSSVARGLPYKQRRRS